jgi:hypothetical protein
LRRFSARGQISGVTPRPRRFTAILAALLLLFGNLRGMAGATCAVHSANGPGRSGTVQDGHAHAGHAAHQAPAGKSAHHQGCTCLEHCQSCQSAGLAAVAPHAAFAFAFIDAAAASTVPVSRIPFRTAYQLPFATAPPAIV